MSPTDIEIDDIAWLFKHLLDLLFVLLPPLLISLELLILMLPFLSKLGLIHCDSFAFSFQLVPFCSEQVLESEHEFLKQSIDRSTFSGLKILNHVLLL